MTISFVSQLPIAPDEFLTTRELAQLLRMHPVTVRLKAMAGEIPGKQVGNRWKFSRQRILEWMAPDAA